MIILHNIYNDYKTLYIVVTSFDLYMHEGLIMSRIQLCKMMRIKITKRTFAVFCFV